MEHNCINKELIEKLRSKIESLEIAIEVEKNNIRAVKEDIKDMKADIKDVKSSLTSIIDKINIGFGNINKKDMAMLTGIIITLVGVIASFFTNFAR